MWYLFKIEVTSLPIVGLSAVSGIHWNLEHTSMGEQDHCILGIVTGKEMAEKRILVYLSKASTLLSVICFDISYTNL